MDKNRVIGSAKQVRGAVKETVGRLLGDEKLETEGKVEQAAGRIQNLVGGAADKAREIVKPSS